MIGYWQIRQRIAAKNRRLVRIDQQPQDNELTRLEDRERGPIYRRENERKSRYRSPYGSA